MKISFMRRSEEGIAIARAIAKAMGQEYDPGCSASDDHLFLTSFFEDIKTALAPRFDHINMMEFTMRRLQAYADHDGFDRPFIHLDQQLDQWLLSGMQVLAVRAFYDLSPQNTEAANVLFARVMMMAFDEEAHKTVREDLVPLFTDFPEPLKIANAISIGALVFIACHELAHHAEGHFGRDDAHAVEFEADWIGLGLMRQVYSSAAPTKILRRYPHAEVGVWALFRFWDLLERAEALKAKQPKRIAKASHPLAEERLARLRPQLMAGKGTEKLIHGFAPAMDQFLIDLKLSVIR